MLQFTLGLVCLLLTRGSSQSVNLNFRTIDAFVMSHNYEREKYGLPPLVWDVRLAATARSYASKCCLLHSGATVGESLYGSKPRINETARIAFASVMEWLKERPMQFDLQWPCLEAATCDRYTQIIWKRTRLFGCAIQYCRHELFDNLVVCHYYPPGNIYYEKPF